MKKPRNFSMTKSARNNSVFFTVFRFITSHRLEIGKIISPLALKIDCSMSYYTRKNPQVVTSLQTSCNFSLFTSCQQVVFALLVPSLL